MDIFNPEAINLGADVLIFLFFTALIAGCVDTLAGGGGLISLPALILSGVPPLAALGTNKLQGCTGTATASFLMFKNRKVNRAEAKPLMLAAFLGSALGTLVVQCIDTDVLSFVIPLVLLFIAVYFLISPTAEKHQGTANLSASTYKNIIVPSIGFYDGMFGPGTGSFFALAGVSCQGKGLISSTALAKTLNFSTNVSSLLIFFMAGQVVWLAGILMMFGQIIGAWIGAHFLFRINPSHLKMLVVLMCSAMLVKYGHSMGWIE